MIKNYFKTAWRSLLAKKNFALLNIAGLSVGVASALLLFLIGRYELSFDKFHRDHESIYRVVLKEQFANGNVELTPGSALPVAEALKADFPELNAIVPVFGALDPQVTILNNDSLAINAPEKFIEKGEGLLVEPGFFDLFNFKWLAGAPAVLAEPNVVVLSRKFAEKYFRDYPDAIGKFVRINNLTTMQVGGVLEDAPTNTTFPLNLVISYASKRAQPELFGFGDFENWNSVSSNDQIFLRLPEGYKEENVNSRLLDFSNKHYRGRQQGTEKTHFLSPLADVHHDGRLSNFDSSVVSRERIDSMLLIGCLILLMACVNFVNIYSALASRRAKEVGVRKVLGSAKEQLVAQFMIETAGMVVASTVVGVLLAYAAFPFMEKMFGVPADLSRFLTPFDGLYLAAMVAGLTLVSGIYPSLILSSFSPLAVFRKNVPEGWMRGVSMRQTLIVFQFATALVLIIGTIVNVRQTDYLNTLDLGFQKEGVFTFTMDPEYRLRSETFRTELLRIPEIKAASFSSDAPSSGNNWASSFSFTDHTQKEDFEVSVKMADGDYFNTYGITFLAGAAYATRDTLTKFVVNETLLKKLGIDDPESVIGRNLKLSNWDPAPIVGVVRDFHTNSAHEVTRPIVVTVSDRFYWRGGVKMQSGNVHRTVAEVNKVFDRVFPEVAFSGSFYDEEINDYYKTQQQMGLLFRVFAGLAVFIACLGLLGLTAFAAEARMKEVSVRKVLGASGVSLVTLLSRDFLKPVLIAIVIGSPVAWYVMHLWLQDFVYRVEIDWKVFAGAGLLAVVVALVTIGFRTVRAVAANPVDSLRAE